MIRLPTPTDRAELLSLAVGTGLFAEAEAEALLGGLLTKYFAGSLGADHAIVVWAPAPDASPLGWVYFAEDEHAPGIWNLWWIGVHPANHGAGIGTALLQFVERAVATAAGRLLVIETSALPALAATRTFYAQRGYRECGRVPDFYASGDDKVIFARQVERSSAPTNA